MRTLYNIFVSLMIFGMKVGALFSYKLKRGIAGRRQSCNSVKQKFAKTDKVIWMHAASLGEYEQGLPVLEKLKENFPSHKILITFFSPSGYENVLKKNPIADVICYLPFDRKKWIDEFTSNFQTDIFFTVKYDFWYNLLEELKSQNAKIYVISAYFYETQIFFSAFGDWFVERLKRCVDWFFHQTRDSSGLAKFRGLTKSSTSGDTRFDRVKQILKRDNFVEDIEEFKGSEKLIVFGSSWESEERMVEVIAAKNQNVKMIIAPHDLKRVEHLKKNFPKAVLYSQIDAVDSALLSHQILIIDCIGLLSKIYSYADIAVVGGGFHKKGLHNILEPAVFGIPVIFGNSYSKNPEADALIAANGAKSFEDEFFAGNFVLGMLKKPEIIYEMGENSGKFVEIQPNSTEIIVKKILADFGEQMLN